MTTIGGMSRQKQISTIGSTQESNIRNSDESNFMSGGFVNPFEEKL